MEARRITPALHFARWAAILLVGCFAPALDEVSCETTGRCPDGQVCVDDRCQVIDNERCGDGVIGGGERCDDGNALDLDGCSPDCSTVRCTAPLTHDSVQALVEDSACPVAYLAPGRYFESVIVDRDLIIEGAGFGDIAIDGAGERRVLEVVSGVRVTLRGFAIRGGFAIAGGGIRNDGALVLERMTLFDNVASGATEVSGGAVWHRQGTLAIRDSLLAGNRVIANGGASQVGSGGALLVQAPMTAGPGARFEGNTVEATGADAIARGGAIDVRGADVLLFDCALRGNAAEAIGGAGATSTTAGGGAISASDGAVVRAVGCAIEDNQVFASGSTGHLLARGGGLELRGARGELAESRLGGNQLTLSGAGDPASAHGGGVFAQDADLAIDASLIDGNRIEAAGQLGTPDLAGAGISIDAAGAIDVALVNSTVTGCAGAGAIAIRDAGASGAIALLHLTVAANAGDGLSLDQSAGASLAVTLTNSISANNGGDSCQASEPTLQGDHNLLADSCEFAGTPVANQIGVDPMLAPLADNGGPTATAALADGSPAIDAASDPCAVLVDQRGESRPFGPGCDVGAFERVSLSAP